MKGASPDEAAFVIVAIEVGGIPSTIVLGWISDRVGGRRGMISSLCMMPVFLAFLGLMYVPKGYLKLDMTLLITIGFFIYPVINLITIAALDVVSKKAIGTAAGFIGLFGYLGSAAEEAGFGWALVHFKKLYGEQTAWDTVFYAILTSAVMAGVLLAFTWNARPKA